MKHNIYRSAAQVTIFSTVEKIISFLYRIFLSRSITAEGVGIYQICLTVFALFLTLSSSGIPVTVSRLIAKQTATGRPQQKHAVVTAGVLCTLIFTIPITILLFCGQGLLKFFFTDQNCIPIFLCILPGLVITSIYSVMRGTFWGNRQFLPYSFIELAEDCVMVFVGIFLVSQTNSPIQGAEKAMLAVLISYIFSFFFSLFWYFLKGGKFVSPKSQLKPLLASSLPITAMRTSTSLLNSVVALLLPALLVHFCNLSTSESLALYGVATGMSIPILFIPSSLIGSIAVVIAPELSENYYKHQQIKLRRDVERSIHAAISIASILTPILFVLGVPVGNFLYSNALSGQIIQNCSFILFPMCISMLSTTILNSLNCELKTLLFFIFGAVGMIVSILTLTKPLGIYSYMIGLTFNFTLTALLNMRLLKKKCPQARYIKFLRNCLLATIISCFFGTMIRNILSLYLNDFLLILIVSVVTIFFTAGFLYCLNAFSLRPFSKILAKR